MPTRYAALALVLMLASACQSIPAPTVQVERKQGGYGTGGGLTAPMQTLWRLDADRWFEGELDHACYGEIRYVDRKKGINSFVDIADVPSATLDSDDPDVVLGALGKSFPQLVFSTNGGRHFVAEVRRLPGGVEFVAVRKGHVYVGIDKGYRDPDGYFKWRSTYVPYRKKESEFSDKLLVILEAKLDKANSRIGKYVLLAPTGYRFKKPVPADAQSSIKRIDDLESLGLPHVATNRSDACDLTLQLPVWHMFWNREDLTEFLAWYEKTKQAHPAWADAKKDKFVESHRIKYRGNP